jgi:uncharacterized protein (DUF2336 family)
MDDHLIGTQAVVPSGRRAALLASVTDLYGQAGHGVSAPTAALYSEIVLGVFDALSEGEQVALADRIALLPNAPAAILCHLATLSAVTAEPVLRHSVAFDDQSLAALAATLPHERLCAMAGRAWISESVSDALLDRGDRVVLRLLAQNPGARFSQHGLAILVEEAEQTLAQRRAKTTPDTDEGEMGQVIAFPSAGKRRGGRRKLASETSKGAVVAMPVAGLAAPVDAPAGTADSPVASVIATVASGDRMLEVAGLLATFAGLPVETVRRMIAKPDTMPLAVLCKAAGVSVATFAAIAAIRGRRHGHGSEVVQTLVRAYEALTAEDVDSTLRFLRARHGASFLADIPISQGPTG